jgi:competence protein ComEC
MVPLALATLATAWCLQQFDAQPLLALPAVAWAGCAAVAWCLGGGRAGLLVLVAGWTLVRAGWLAEERLPDSLAGRDLLVRGVVCDFPRGDAAALRFLLHVEATPGAASFPRRLHLSWYDAAPGIRPGERWQLLVRLRPPRGLRNPGGFDFEQWLYARGIGASGYVRASRLDRRLATADVTCPVGTARGMLARHVESALGPHPAAGYVLGITVGATHRLADADWDLLRRTGTTHLLAISGLNIAMVAAPFLLAGPLLSRTVPALAGRAYAGLPAAMLVAAGYSALSGFAVSTVRALVMIVIAGALTLVRRRVDGPDLLGAAALAILVLDPAAVISASFWLSFVAVGCLFVAVRPRARPAERAPGRVRRHAAAAVALLRAQLVLGMGLLPLLVAWFGQASLVAPLANLVAVPVFSLGVMPLALSGAALVLPAPGAGSVLLQLAADLVDVLLGFLRLAGSLRHAVWQAPVVDATGLALAGAAALWLCWWRPLPLRSLAAALLLPVLFGSAASRPSLRVTVLDVGQGLSVLVETAHHALLYDAGPAFRMRDVGESVVVPALRHAGIRRLDLLMISHADQDHAGGAGAVLATFPGTPLSAPRALPLVAASFSACAAGQSWTWDGVLFAVISPVPGEGTGADNDGSCVLQVTAAASAILLPGDIGARREAELARRGLLAPSDLVIAPHHGSRSSSSAALVAATRPLFVVFSAGHRNRWSFPAREVSARWAASGACLVETASGGALVFEEHPGGPLHLVRRERIDAARLWTADARPTPACAMSTGAQTAEPPGVDWRPLGRS